MMLHKDIHLNDNQKEAVDYNSGPLLIIAGAGTGKTHVLVEKIKNLIQKKLAKPEQILALTFTEKAAAEMEERVDQAVPYGYFQMYISTFHSFADQIIREQGLHIGLNTSYRLLTEAESLLFLKQNLFLLDLNYFRPMSNPNKFLGALLSHFSRLKDEDIGPDDYEKWANKLKKKKNIPKEEINKYAELARAYKMYQSIKIKEGYFDFSDLMYYALDLLRKRKNILEQYRHKYPFILVDEFQDTNIAQYALIKLLCPNKSNPHLTIVGDDSQAIYKFRGASVSNILAFMHDYPKARQISLQQNYRSNQTILDAAYRLIKNNDPDTLEARLGISKNLIANKRNIPDAVALSISSRGEEEADYVTNIIRGLLKNYKYSDFAILTRAHSHADPFIRSLQQKNIPYQLIGPGMLYKQPEVKDFIAYLKLLYNLEDSVALYRILCMDIFSLDQKDISLLLTFAKKSSLSLFHAIEVLLITQPENYKPFFPEISEQTKTALIAIYTMIIKHLSLAKKETAGQILYYFLENTGYLQKLATYKTEKEEKQALNISRFFNKLKAFESENEDSSIYAVVDYLDMSMELGESPYISIEDINLVNAVNILTIHASKGLEFPVVFIANCTRGRFPTNERKEIIPIPDELIKEQLPIGDYHLEEERRLFYVGMTRAKDRLYITLSKWYGEGKREQRISPFVTESIGKEHVDSYQIAKSEQQAQLAMFSFEKPVQIYEQPPLITRPTIFSYSQLETYERCPLQYKYNYVLKIPTLPKDVTSFGTSIHTTLQEFYKEYLKSRTIGKNRLLQIYESSWIPVGYNSKKQASLMKSEGKRLLNDYFKTFHSTKLNVVDVEKVFKIKIAESISITGKIDRVDKYDNGIEIVDYKTGKKPNEKDLKKNIQLSVYATAVNNKNVYDIPLEKIKLTFFYLQNNEKISFSRSEEDILQVKEKIMGTVEKIQSAKYEPHVGPWCDYCPFRLICEAWQ